MDFQLADLNELITPLTIFIALSMVVGVIIGIMLRRSRVGEMEDKIQKSAQRLFREMEGKHRSGLLEEKRAWHQARGIQETEINDRKASLETQEQELLDRQRNYEQRNDNLREREENTTHRESDLEKLDGQLKLREKQIGESAAEYRKNLESLAGLTSEEAKHLSLIHI